MDPRPFVIAIPVYDGVNLMDIAAPREVFFWAGTASSVAARYAVEILFVGGSKTVESLNGVRFEPDAQFGDEAAAAPDLLWVPGGSPDALRRMLDRPDAPFFRYIERVGATAGHVCSVCEGAVLLASTGLLDGFRATTHWNFYDCMAAYPEVEMVGPIEQGDAYLYPRYVHDDTRVTGGGITSGLDEALYIVTLLFGAEVAEWVARLTQYAPDPPVTARLGLPEDCPIPPSAAAPRRTYLPTA